MGDYNFLKELKRTALEFLDGLYSMFCTGLVVIYIIFHQTKIQSDAINIILNSGDWYVFIPMLVGLFALGFTVRYILTGIYKILRFLFQLIFIKMEDGK